MRAAIINIVILLFFVTLITACAPSNNQLAFESIEQGRYEEAVGYLKECSKRGDARCDYRLGMMLVSGQGIERDVAAAQELFINAGKKGIPAAHLELGNLLSRGEGVEKNPKKAIYWYRKAADAGLPQAQSRLGVLFANGEGVEQNEVIAAEWYRKAANASDPLGQAALGIATFNGIGVPENMVEGYMWTQLAADQGNEKALSILPTMEAELTSDELVTAQSKVRKFRPESAKKRQRVDARKLRRTSSDTMSDTVNRRRTGTPAGY